MLQRFVCAFGFGDMLVCGEGDSGLGIEFAEDNAVDAVFVGVEVQIGILVAVVILRQQTEYQQP